MCSRNSKEAGKAMGGGRDWREGGAGDEIKEVSRGQITQEFVGCWPLL